MNVKLVGGIVAVLLVLFAFMTRYQIVSSSSAVTLRMDRWTGKTWKTYSDMIWHEVRELPQAPAP